MEESGSGRELTARVAVRNVSGTLNATMNEERAALPAPSRGSAQAAHLRAGTGSVRPRGSNAPASSPPARRQARRPRVNLPTQPRPIPDPPNSARPFPDPTS